jgi:hypothetical protein
MEAITVFEERNEVKVDINTKIYNYNAILLSVKDFLDTNWVYFDGQNDISVSVFIKPKKQEGKAGLELLGYEFYNYVLGIMENGL